MEDVLHRNSLIGVQAAVGLAVGGHYRWVVSDGLSESQLALLTAALVPIALLLMKRCNIAFSYAWQGGRRHRIASVWAEHLRPGDPAGSALASPSAGGSQFCGRACSPAPGHPATILGHWAHSRHLRALLSRRKCRSGTLFFFLSVSASTVSSKN